MRGTPLLPSSCQGHFLPAWQSVMWMIFPLLEVTPKENPSPYSWVQPGVAPAPVVSFCHLGRGGNRSHTHKGKKASQVTVWLMELRDSWPQRRVKSVSFPSPDRLFNWYLVSGCLNLDHTFSFYSPRCSRCFPWREPQASSWPSQGDVFLAALCSVLFP